ncbi:erythromycin esterase family protein, partial [Streptomyces sp. MP131-18]|uniref:erythromycin esterase family protein n=1 Tax=Streptomyces sp. MP131-18 TaxID=1857892 RepID=UPI00097BC5B7
MPPVSRRALLGALPVTAAGLAAAAGPAAAARPGERRGDAVAALARAARPLRTTEPHGPHDDLAPLGAAIGEVPVVGLGEVVHGAHELYTLKHRVFRYLVAEKGFRTFALEVSWGAGLRIDSYVRNGSGDLRTILDEEFGNGAWPWHVEEYLNLIAWMRAHNARHRGASLRFMGNDLAFPRIADTIFDGVTGWADRYAPGLRPELDACYLELREHAAAADFQALPDAERQRIAGLARQAADRVAALDPAPGGAAHAWAAQHARVLAQTATLLAFRLNDPAEQPAAMRYRDELMAVNTAWWHRQTGDKVLLSAHNGHTAYETYDPVHYPVTQGAYLRDLLGASYLAVGTTFGRGSWTEPDGSGEWQTTPEGPPRAGSSEEILERAGRLAGHRDFLLDVRTAPAAARAWLSEERPTRDIGPPGDPYRPFILAAGHDALIHLHAFGPARRLP